MVDKNFVNVVGKEYLINEQINFLIIYVVVNDDSIAQIGLGHYLFIIF